MRRALALAALLALGSAACFEFDKKLEQICGSGRFACEMGSGGGAESWDGSFGGGTPLSSGGLEFTGGICSGAWCYENPFPHALDINGIWGSGPNDVWVVSNSNVALHFDGGAWQAFTPAMPVSPSNPRASLNGVFGFSADDVWVVAEGDGPFHLGANGVWAADPAFTFSNSFFAITGSADGGLWVASNEISVKHGDTWERTSTGGSWQNRAIVAVTDDECRAVFNDVTASLFLVARCDGSAPIDAGRELYSAWGRAGERFFGSEGGVSREADAGVLEGPLATGMAVQAGAMIPGGGDWVAVGSNASIFRSARMARERLGAADPRTLQATWVNRADDFWVGGQGGALAHFDGGRYTSLQTGERLGTLIDVQLRSLLVTPRYQLAAATDGRVLVREANGTWRATPTQASFLLTLAEIPGGLVYAVGAGIEVFDGGEWVAEDVSSTFRGVWGSAPDDVWATGDVVSHRSATGWTQVSGAHGAGVGHQYWKVAGSRTRGEVWAAGERGGAGFAARLNLDGGHVFEVPDPTEQVLYGIAVAERGTDVWAVGRSGRLYLRGADAGWTRRYASTMGALADVFLAGDDDVWISGDEVVAHGSRAGTFRESRPPTGSASLTTVRRLGDEVFVVGDRHGIILRASASKL